MEANLLASYNQPVPRYTSYPTVPFWKENLDPHSWRRDLIAGFARCNEKEGISLYLHLPFCESLCIYCGCNKKITTNHNVEEQYLDAILKEWSMYREMMEHPPVIRELHLGGGTPTFFSPGNLHRLVSTILAGAVVHPEHAFSIEGHPNNTTREHLDVLYALGFRRISYGVQDLNPEVQLAIRRWQPFERLSEATEAARDAGFTAVNFDLIYGLPLQTPERLRHTIDLSLSLRPDRIAFYSYAHTPSVNCAQRLIDSAQLPSPEEKLYLYQLGKVLLEEQGYANIGMDHFALPADELFIAWKDNRLHRNFMGYTTQHSGMLLGLGVSAISDLGMAYAQNDKSLAGYYRAIAEGRLAISRGYRLTAEDMVFKRYILDIACKGYTRLDPAWTALLQEWTLPRLQELQKDGLVTLNEERVALTEAGRPFLRHVCKAFDLVLLRDERVRENLALCKTPAFSRGI
ncbi:oxygen-independent coproporphyrinogen III oxidase [Puia dinghuensis]|uniref:Coproporphyrinogen-III oxidase n=1 Tax=Puia dinghuensis TaxID=1792502 RepID=A0A8J2UBR1_9BACT|nr:oxygen-independent coproporphyrinogen III oxidase [Puia dinghuensis]GGA94808.1 coproporphyrinogen-III oxidase [Puia dinghuensis]